MAHSASISDPRVRKALTAYLLDVGDPDRVTPRRRWRLAYPGLADQLRPALRAPLAEDAVQEVVPEIEALVVSADVNSYLRSSAAHGLADLDSDRAVAALRGVLDEVMEHPDHDPEDELRGIALEACWPKALAVPELLPALTAPNNPNYFSSYQFFLPRLVEKLTDQELVDLVRAVAAPAVTHDQTIGDVTWVDEDDLDPAVPLLRGTRRDERLLVELVDQALNSPLLAACTDEAGWLLAQAMRRGLPLPPVDHRLPRRRGDREGGVPTGAGSRVRVPAESPRCSTRCWSTARQGSPRSSVRGRWPHGRGRCPV